MNDWMEQPDRILNDHITGFHRYVLTEPAGLCFASRNLGRMLGREPEDLVSRREDRYLPHVHPAHRQAYLAALAALAREPGTKTLCYRLLTASGRELYVNDDLTSSRLSDGTMVCDSVLTDITQLKSESQNLQHLNDTAPCGFLKYTCEAQPRLTYINQQMKAILRLPPEEDGGAEPSALYQGSLYLMIPPQERQRMAGYLNRVYRKGAPIAGEITVLRWDGTQAHLFGWVTKTVNAQGREEFQSVCMDVTHRHQQKLRQQAQRYLKALTDVYDLIFAFDRSAGTVKCLFAGDSPVFAYLLNLPMQMREGAYRWIRDTVCREDQNRVEAFFREFFTSGQEEGQPPRISYTALNRQGVPVRYNGVFLKMEDSVSWFCCRRVPEAGEVDQLRSENSSLKENMQELMLRFTDGLAAFELRGEMVTPLYASDNVCQFFGYSREQWLKLMRQGAPIRDFVARSDASYSQFMALLENGEGEFSYFDLNTESERRIKAICSQKSPGDSPVRYVMLYSLEQPEGRPGQGEPAQVYVRTFGYFDVFIGDKPIAFRNQKSKELLALLVDRRGGFITSQEAISFLWEDEPVSQVTLARYRKVALRLKNILEEYGISHIVETVDGKRRIVPERIRCDLYEYLAGGEGSAQSFKGSYLTNYSWAEATLASLTGSYLN